jgi:hypothetical protein
MPPFYVKVSELFNNAKYTPRITNHNLHKDFADLTELRKPEGYDMDPDIAKSLPHTVKTKLSDVIRSWEKKCNGSGMREIGSDDFGKFDTDNCGDGDDRFRFCDEKPYLLNRYYWHFCLLKWTY